MAGRAGAAVCARPPAVAETRNCILWKRNKEEFSARIKYFEEKFSGSFGLEGYIIEAVYDALEY